MSSVYEVLRNIVSRMTGAALIRKHPRQPAPEITMLGGSLSTTDTEQLLSSPNKVVRTTRHRPAAYYITLPLPILTYPCWLTVELTRSQLTDYERQFLAFTCKELSHIIVSEQGREEVVERFAELRHAIRSGLTGVVGHVHEALGCFELYRELDYAPSVLSQARFRKALERANFAAAKTQSLLEESRFLLGNISPDTLRLGRYRIDSVVKAAIDSIQPYAAERHLEICVNNHLSSRADWASFDKPLIEMMLFNLLDNAVKYSYRGNPININLDRTKDSWRFRVTDVGVAIAPEDSEVIFEPFTRRLPEGISARHPGTGLGLAVSRAIARAHHGEIVLQSVSAGQDSAITAFTVTIPLVTEGAP